MTYCHHYKNTRGCLVNKFHYKINLNNIHVTAVVFSTVPNAQRYKCLYIGIHNVYLTIHKLLPVNRTVACLSLTLLPVIKKLRVNIDHLITR